MPVKCFDVDLSGPGNVVCLNVDAEIIKLRHKLRLVCP